MNVAERNCFVCNDHFEREIPPIILMPCFCVLHEHCMQIFEKCDHGAKSTRMLARIKVINRPIKAEDKSVPKYDRSSESFAEGNASVIPAIYNIVEQNESSNFVFGLLEKLGNLIGAGSRDVSEEQDQSIEKIVNTVSASIQYAQNQHPPLTRVLIRWTQKIEDSAILRVKARLEECDCQVLDTIETEFIEKIDYSSTDYFDSAFERVRTVSVQSPALEVVIGSTHVVVIFKNRQ